MSAVEILAYAAADDTGDGSAVDVSAFSTLRLDWHVVADLSRNPDITLTIETGPTASGPWTEIYRRQMVQSHQISGDPYRWEALPRVTLAGFDSYVRPRWRCKADTYFGAGNRAASLSIGLSGDGQPDAP